MNTAVRRENRHVARPSCSAAFRAAGSGSGCDGGLTRTGRTETVAPTQGYPYLSRTSGSVASSGGRLP
jgi:hypothetical protein